MSMVPRFILALGFLLASTGHAWAAAPVSGTGGLDFPASLVPTTDPTTGQAGRLVILTGAISGSNFEPGICNPYTAANAPAPFLIGKCVNFTTVEPVPPGGFKRTH